MISPYDECLWHVAIAGALDHAKYVWLAAEEGMCTQAEDGYDEAANRSYATAAIVLRALVARGDTRAQAAWDDWRAWASNEQYGHWNGLQEEST